MSNAVKVIEEIGFFLDKFSLKTNKLSKDDLINFIEQKWVEADDEKYNIHQSYIYISRMTNEYIWKKDFKNMMRWLYMSDLHSSSKRNATYIRNYYKGQCCLECGNKEKALEYFFLCYNENSDYIFTRAPFCYEFFNKHLEKPRELAIKAESTNKGTKKKVVELKEWQLFFNEKRAELRYEIFDEDYEDVAEPSEMQKESLEYLQNNQMKVLENILSKLLDKYPDLEKIYNYTGEKKKYFMPDLTSIKGFADLLTPTCIYVISRDKEDIPHIGFNFSCSWDSEHGLGVMTHKGEVINIGGAEDAFML